MFLHQSPVFRLLLPFLFGVVVMIIVPFPIIYAIAFFILLLTLHLFFQFTQPLSSSYKLRWIGGSIINGIFFLAGCIITWFNSDLNNNSHFSYSSGHIYTATVEEPPVYKEKTVKVIASIHTARERDQQTQSTGKLMIYISNTGDVHLKYGDCFIFSARPQRVATPKNPEEFNYARYLAFHNIYHQTYLQKGKYRKLNINEKIWLFDASYRLREYLVHILKETIHDKDIYSVGSALLVGYEDDLEIPLLNAYASSGTLHVLSVSGMHVAVIYKVLEWLLRFLLKIKRGRHIYYIVVLSFIWFYAFLTGLSPSVLRAAMMLNFVIVGKWSGRNTGVLNTLAVSCFLLIIYNPFLIAEVGFQLSFLAVFGIVFLHPVLFRIYEPPNKFLFAVWSIVSVSLCAQLITFPLGLFYFHQFPNFFLIANILIIPATTAAIYSCIALVILYKVPFLGMMIAKFCYASIWFSNETAKYIDRIPFAVINGISINVFEMFFIYVIITAGLWYLMQQRWMHLAIFLGLIVIFQLLQVVENISFSHQRIIAVCDLRGHTAISLIEGRHCFLITDTLLRKDDNAIRFHLQQYWWKQGVSKPCFVTDGLKEGSLVKNGHAILFNEKKIILIDSLYAVKLKKHIVPDVLRVNFLVLSGNAPISLQKLSGFFKFDKVIIDESNSYSKIKKWKREAQRLRINYYSLDEKGAFVQSM